MRRRNRTIPADTLLCGNFNGEMFSCTTLGAFYSYWYTRIKVIDVEWSWIGGSGGGWTMQLLMGFVMIDRAMIEWMGCYA